MLKRYLTRRAARTAGTLTINALQRIGRRGREWVKPHPTYETLTGGLTAGTIEPGPVPLTSSVCRQADFLRDGYRYWMAAIREQPLLHRKQWEFFFIIQALNERGLLAEGRRGLGFGVGTEPMPALFANRGVRVTASDQGLAEAMRAGWAETAQHSASIDLLNTRGICPADRFRSNVAFREIDMNAIPADLDQKFDFCWSACCLEHLGSLNHGLDFITASIATLRPGGIAVHTTEFNLTSNDATFESPHLSIYRRRDIERVVHALERAGHHVEPIDWSTGTGLVDTYVDLPPYRQEPHLRLRLREYACTSIGLIIRRGGTLGPPLAS